jgi:hypothetical protein
VWLLDLIDYQRNKRAQPRAQLDGVTHEAAKAWLYDNGADYTEAIKHARKRKK